ncbi:MAG TPA: hypothetical protein VL418_14730 [Devosiaceae bacterium]|jgi:hypothetical protein|nr:hypothetical protein [Devosiaceae bacterium]
MADEPDNRDLTALRRIEHKFDLLLEDVRELKVRLTGAQEGLVVAQRRIDRVEGRVERRLDLYGPVN